MLCQGVNTCLHVTLCFPMCFDKLLVARNARECRTYVARRGRGALFTAPRIHLQRCTLTDSGHGSGHEGTCRPARVVQGGGVVKSSRLKRSRRQAGACAVVARVRTAYELSNFSNFKSFTVSPRRVSDAYFRHCDEVIMTSVLSAVTFSYCCWFIRPCNALRAPDPSTRAGHPARARPHPAQARPRRGLRVPKASRA